MGTKKLLKSYKSDKAKIFPQEEYLSLTYRKHLLSVPADESLLGRFMWAVSARNRRFAIDQVKNWKLKEIKDDIQEHLESLFGAVLQNALTEANSLNKPMSDVEFLDGFLAKDWNVNAKYPTVFDTLSEAIEIWHRYHLGISNVLERDEWISLTSEKLKWPKKRYGTNGVQPYDRPLAIRRHFPFDDERDFINSLQPDAGVFKMFGKDIPEEVRKINV